MERRMRARASAPAAAAACASMMLLLAASVAAARADDGGAGLVASAARSAAGRADEGLLSAGPAGEHGERVTRSAVRAGAGSAGAPVGLATGEARGLAQAAASSLTRAIELYEEARYEDALAMLDVLGKAAGSAPGHVDREAATEYRVLCLLALGRNEEAATAAEGLFAIRADYAPRSADAPPPLRKLVAATRQQVLPRIVREEYRAGKAGLDGGDRVEAARHFREVARLLGQVDLDSALRDSLADVGELAAGFLTLIETPVPASPAGGGRAIDRAPGRGAEAPPSPDASQRADGLVYSVEHTDVVPPAIIRQDVPSWRSVLVELPAATPKRALLEVIIDASGQVDQARLLSPLHPRYDSLLLNSARRWRYRPATRNGQPVAFKKLIQIALVGDPPRS